MKSYKDHLKKLQKIELVELADDYCSKATDLEGLLKKEKEFTDDLQQQVNLLIEQKVIDRKKYFAGLRRCQRIITQITGSVDVWQNDNIHKIILDAAVFLGDEP